MKYMLDTNICIYLIKNNNEVLIKKIKTFNPGDICISSITSAELYFGVRKSERISSNVIALENFLSNFSIIPFDNDDSVYYGLIRADLARKGEIIGALDLMIGAQAVSKELILITNNEKEFIRIENLKVENWSK